MRKEDACGSDRGYESPLKTGQHRNINNAQYTKGAKNPEKQHATASVNETEAGNKGIVFDRVTFSYNKTEANLKNLSFFVKKGEMLGVIGATGSGKTTLATLLMRLVDVDEGRILIDGRDVRSFEKKELREKFGVVFQNDTILRTPFLKM